MRFTNKADLPKQLFDALSYEPRSHKVPKRPLNQISVTSLIAPPIIRVLKMMHDDDIVEDVSERVWTLLGSNVHNILEHRVDGTTSIPEEKLRIEVKDYKNRTWTITGVPDLLSLENGQYVLYDWKVTSAWSVVLGGLKPEWIAQLNMYARLYKEAGFDIALGKVVCILRDWSKLRAKSDGDYPPFPFHVFDLKRVLRFGNGLWSSKRVDSYIKDRIDMHAKALNIALCQDFDPETHTAEDLKESDSLQACSSKERWEKPTKWTVMKEGRKTAVRVFDDKTRAENFLITKDGKHYVEKRKGENTRCLHYCSVAPFCKFGKNL